MSAEVADITPFPKPKRVTITHRNMKATLVYNPDTRKWDFDVVVTRKIDLRSKRTGYASQGIAQRYAREEINILLDGER